MLICLKKNVLLDAMLNIMTTNGYYMYVVKKKNGICFYFGFDLGNIFRWSRHLKDGYFFIVKRKKASIRVVNALFQNILTEIQVSMWKQRSSVWTNNLSSIPLD